MSFINFHHSMVEGFEIWDELSLFFSLSLSSPADMFHWKKHHQISLKKWLVPRFPKKTYHYVLVSRDGVVTFLDPMILQ